MLNRFDKSIDKNSEAYHAAQANYIYKVSNNQNLRYSHLKSVINRAFFAGNQWIFDDDLELFLKDESGNIRNRIRFVHNIIKPVVRQFIGNAVRTVFEYSAIPTSTQAITRRESKLAERLALQDMTKEFPYMKETIQKNFPVGNSKEETVQLFEGDYVDEYALAINYLISNVASTNKFEQLKVILAENAALDGAAIVFEYEYNGEMIFKPIKLQNFILDTTIKMPDASDAMYAGHFSLYGVSQIAERFNTKLTSAKLSILETAVKRNQSVLNATNGATAFSSSMYGSAGGSTQLLFGQVPLFEIYWDDVVEKEYGIFVDDYGYECIKEVGDGEGYPYTRDKLVKAPREKVSIEFLEGKETKKIYRNETRYCIFVPSDYMTDPASTKPDDNNTLVIDYGILEGSQNDSIFKERAYLPYKISIWKLDDGRVLAPIDDMIHPQRYINRMLSIAENHVNTARPSGTVINKNTVDTRDGEEQIVRDINVGRPIFLDADQGITNAIGSYGATIGDGASQLHRLAGDVKGMADASVGVNENMVGTGGGYRVSSAVTASNILQGTIMQEDFYFLLSSVLKDCYTSIAKRGKLIYLKNKRKLSIMVGDRLTRILELDPMLQYEDFRIEIKRTQNATDLIQAGNEMLTFFLQSQLIDTDVYSKHFNVSTPNEAVVAMKRFQAAVSVAKSQAAQQQQMAGQAQGEAALLEAMSDKESAIISEEKKLAVQENKNDIALIQALNSKQPGNQMQPQV